MMRQSGISDGIQGFDYDYSWDADIFLYLVLGDTSVFS